MKKNLYKLFALLFTMGLFIVSCDNVSPDEPQLDDEITQDNALASSAVGDIFSAVDNGTTTGKAVSNCPTAELNVINRLLTLTYGTDGSVCTGADGIERSGVITASFSAFSQGWAKDAVATIGFSNYTYDGKTLTGSMTITCNSLNPVEFKIIATDMILTWEDQKTMKWSSDNTFTIEKTDAEGKHWKINGTTTGTARSGKNFTRTDTNLIKSPDCRWFTGGIIDLVIGGEDTYKMEFSGCGDVTFTYKGITIKRQFPVE